MRVIAGSARRLQLLTPRGLKTRPTQDRVKETLFNILQDEVEGAYFLDLFAGSGQMGIEALSRGARAASFVDQGREAIACIQENLRRCHLEKRAKVIASDVSLALALLDRRDLPDLVFMDPPYGQDFEEGVLRQLRDLLRANAIVIIESPLNSDFSYAESLGYQIDRIKRYKTNQHVFLSLE